MTIDILGSNLNNYIEVFFYKDLNVIEFKPINDFRYFDQIIRFKPTINSSFVSNSMMIKMFPKQREYNKEGCIIKNISPTIFNFSIFSFEFETEEEALYFQMKYGS